MLQGYFLHYNLLNKILQVFDTKLFFLKFDTETETKRALNLLLSNNFIEL